jgi:tRNA A-37 threonylcarbamoyl transferase component Bud32
LTTAAAFLDLPGEVVSGHPDRHVARVEVAGRACYLKRQHRVGRRERLRQWLAGFGWSSRSEREVVLLQQLEAAGFACPQWVAHGEDGRGRAFLLVEELAGAVELRRLLSDNRLSPDDRRRLAERLGQAVAELHAAGFDTPDLTAKHVFVHPETLAVTLIDWQSARVCRENTSEPLAARPASQRPATEEPGLAEAGYRRELSPVAGLCEAGAIHQTHPIRVRRLGWSARVRSLAALHASLAETLAGAADRLRFLWAYRRVTRRHGPAAPKFAALAREITREAVRVAERRSIRDQRQPAVTGSDQRLVWLAGEAVCAVPDVAAVWPTPAVGPPFYSDAPPDGPVSIRLPDGRPAELLRFRTVAPVGRLLARLRGRSWRSPGATLGRVLFHLRRYGVPAPRLLAFGQRLTGPAAADSFALSEPPAGVPLADWLREPRPLDDRRDVLTQAGLLLRQLHDAGCRSTGPAFRVDDLGRVSVGDVRHIRIVRKLTERARRADLAAIVGGLSGVSRADRLRVVAAYFGRRRPDDRTRERMAPLILG